MQANAQLLISFLRSLIGYSALALALSSVSLPILAAETKQKLHTVGYIDYPKPNYGTGEQRKLIERGEYLTKAADCVGCHTDTKHSGPAFAGGLAINTPFGIIYSPNITPDKKTGIGNWTDKDFIRALHDGVAPDGSNYFPVFPFTSFNKVSKDDVLAIKAYLFSLPPVKRDKPENEMLWPFNYRFLQYGWKILFFYFNKGEYQYDPNHTTMWNRGAYLVQGLGHCGECHTPRNIFGAMKRKYYLTGGFVDGYFAPDITSYGLADTSIEEVVDVFTKEEMLKGAGRVEGPMEEVDHNSLQKISRGDLHAMVVYLQTVKSRRPKMAANTGPLTIEEGKDVYETHCATCHATGGAGAPITGDAAVWTERLKPSIDIIYKHAINGYNSMPPRGTCVSCSDDEIKGAVDYMISVSKPGTAALGTKIPTPPIRLSMDMGKKIYEESCAACHTTGKDGAQKLGDKAAWAPLLKENIDVLIYRTINGHKKMPARGNCDHCTNAELIAAVKYMAQEGTSNDNNYSLW